MAALLEPRRNDRKGSEPALDPVETRFAVAS